jgi:DNA-binding beta-propeller fold protein YncE
MIAGFLQPKSLPTMKRILALATVPVLVGYLASCSDVETTAPTLANTDVTPTTVELSLLGRFTGGGVGAAEIPAFDPASKRAFMVNGAAGTVDVLDLSNPAAPTRVGTINVAILGAGVNSVAVANGLVALAVEAPVKTDPGRIALYRASDLTLLGSAVVGALPDMLTFTPDGRTVLVANEGEPNAAYNVDPEGSISIVDVTNPVAPTVRTADFRAFNGQEATLRGRGIRIFGPNATAAQDFEPEYITVSADGRTAWVTLQENNAIAVVSITDARVTDVMPLGYKNHSLTGNGMDASDRDSAVNIRNWPVLGMYQPDAIVSYVVGSTTYLVTANEGDARDYTGFAEERRVSALTLDPAVFTAAVCGGDCKANDRLGRLNVTSTLGNGANGYTQLYAFGSRSFSIWNATTGAQVYDSGEELERRTTGLSMVNFNASNDNNNVDDRSDNKGPEPEGIALARFGSKTFAFIGLERVGGVIVYDITNPAAPIYTTYINTRTGATGDLGPEGLTVVPAAQSPTGVPLLIVGNEISGTTAIFQITLR